MPSLPHRPCAHLVIPPSHPRWLKTCHKKRLAFDTVVRFCSNRVLYHGGENGGQPAKSRFSQNYSFFCFTELAAISVSSEGPAPLHVGSVSVGVASVRVRGFYGSREKETPPAPCMVGGPSLSTLTVIGTACFFAGQLSSSDFGQGELSRSAALAPKLRRSQRSSRSNRTSLASGGTRPCGLSSSRSTALALLLDLDLDLNINVNIRQHACPWFMVVFFCNCIRHCACLWSFLCSCLCTSQITGFIAADC